MIKKTSLNLLPLVFQYFYWPYVSEMSASFCQFTHIPHSKSVTQRWGINSQHSQRGFYKSTLYWQVRPTGIQTLQSLFQDIPFIFSACYQGQCLQSSAKFYPKAGCSLLQVELGCSLRPWSFQYSTVLMLCILSEHYLDSNQLISSMIKTWCLPASSSCSNACKSMHLHPDGINGKAAL